MIRLNAISAAIIAMVLAGSPAVLDPIRDAQWHLAYLDVADAHKINQGAGVTVALIDTGVDSRHPDLSGSLVAGTDFSIDGPGDGLIDRDGHGTSQAGLIAGQGKVLGIAPHAKVQSVRISTSRFVQASLEQAIDWAREHGARVLCIAYGPGDSPALREAVLRALRADVVIVASVGNMPVSAVEYPAAYPGVVGAAAVDQNGNHDAVSATGPGVVLAAPGKEIMSTDTLDMGTGGYGTVTGTSASTAIIAGAAALVRSKYPNLSAAEVVHRLTATADDKGPPGRDPEYGYGVVNLVKALTADVPPLQPTQTAATSAAASPSIGGEAGGGSRSVLLVAIVVIGILLAAGGFIAWRRATDV
jgi:type VII secretion-associated serine protease mycosin